MTISKKDKIIRQGELSFIIKRGVLGWGLTTAFLYTLVTYIFENGFEFFHISSTDFFKELIITFIVFPLSGLFCGLVMWKLINRPDVK